MMAAFKPTFHSPFLFVGQPGVGPGPLDFQSSASTELASAPFAPPICNLTELELKPLPQITRNQESKHYHLKTFFSEEKNIISKINVRFEQFVGLVWFVCLVSNNLRRGCGHTWSRTRNLHLIRMVL